MGSSTLSCTSPCPPGPPWPPEAAWWTFWTRAQGLSSLSMVSQSQKPNDTDTGTLYISCSSAASGVKKCDRRPGSYSSVSVKNWNLRHIKICASLIKLLSNLRWIYTVLWSEICTVHVLFYSINFMQTGCPPRGCNYLLIGNNSFISSKIFPNDWHYTNLIMMSR